MFRSRLLGLLVWGCLFGVGFGMVVAGGLVLGLGLWLLVSKSVELVFGECFYSEQLKMSAPFSRNARQPNVQAVAQDVGLAAPAPRGNISPGPDTRRDRPVIGSRLTQRNLAGQPAAAAYGGQRSPSVASSNASRQSGASISSTPAGAKPGTSRAHGRKTVEHDFTSKIFAGQEHTANLYEDQSPMWWLFYAAMKVADRAGIHSKYIEDIKEGAIENLFNGKETVVISDESALQVAEDLLGAASLQQAQDAFSQLLASDAGMPSANHTTYLLPGLSKRQKRNADGKAIPGAAGEEYVFSKGGVFARAQDAFGAIVARHYNKTSTLKDVLEGCRVTQEFEDATRGNIEDKIIMKKREKKDAAHKPILGADGKAVMEEVPDQIATARSQALHAYLRQVQSMAVAGAVLPYYALVKLYAATHPGNKVGVAGAPTVTAVVNGLLGMQKVPVVLKEGKKPVERVRQVIDGQVYEPQAPSPTEMGK